MRAHKATGLLIPLNHLSGAFLFFPQWMHFCVRLPSRSKMISWLNLWRPEMDVHFGWLILFSCFRG
jgi:hypothetical protein